jgi:hypothetical protein
VAEQTAVANEQPSPAPQTDAGDIEPTQEAADADLAAGFAKVHSLKEGSPEAQPPAETPQPAADEAAAKKTADEAAAKAAQAAAPSAETQRAQYDAALKTHVDTEVRKVYSKIGELNRTIQELTKNLAAGKNASRKITSEALARVNAELPGLGDALALDLDAILNSPVAAAQVQEARAEAEAKGVPFDPEKYYAEKVAPALQAVEARSQAALPAMLDEARQKARLDIVHDGWEDTVKLPEFTAFAYVNGPTPEERAHLAQLEATDPQAAERQLAAHMRKYPQWWADTGNLVMSEKASDAIRLLDAFKARKTPAARQSTTSRLERAIAPKGGGATPAPAINDEEADLAAGFQKVARKR